MTIVDANILLYAYHAESPHHNTAAAWFEELISGSDIVGLPWMSLWAFIRVSTNPRVWAYPVPTDALFEVIRS